MDPADLDALLDRELRELPRPRAPRTLLPRVLAATGGRLAPVPPRPTGWSTWSLGRRLVASAAMLAVVVVAWMLTEAPPATVTEAAETAGDAATVVRVLWTVLLQPVATYIFVLGVSLTLACAGAWAALEVALGGASHR